MIRIIYTLLFLSGVVVLFTSNAAGPGLVQRRDLTGSPLSNPTGSFCVECHSAGAFSPSLTFELLENGLPVSQYEPGKVYKMRVKVNHSGAATGFGFQAVALTTANATAGNFAAPPAGLRISTVNSRRYVEHSSRRPTNTFEIDWAAPVAGTGSVRMFAAGIAANSNNDSSGDGAAKAALLIEEKAVSSVNNNTKITFKTTLIENPVQDNLRMTIESAKSEDIRVQILTLGGSSILEEKIALMSGQNNVEIPAAQLKTGVYLVRTGNESGYTISKIMKI